MIMQIFHTFFIQTFFNYHTMLSVGACYLLDKLMQGKTVPRSIRLRLIIFFNGHPYLVPYAVSAIATEIQNKNDENKINRFIESVSGILGAVGDQFYWNGLKPFVIIVAILSMAISRSVLVYSIFLICLFLLYNFIQIYERYHGLCKGRELGFQVVSSLKSIKQRWAYLHLAKISFFLVLLFIIISIFQYQDDMTFIFIIFFLLTLSWGIVASSRGNTKKYYLYAGLTYVLFEYLL